MDIEIRCESCGKRLGVPRQMAGQRQTCPVCHHDLYVPLPEDEIEDLPLSPENPEDLEQEARLKAERRRLDLALAREADPGPGALEAASRAARVSPHASGRPPAPEMVEKAVMAWLAAMRDADLEAAERALGTVRLQPRKAAEILDRMASDALPPSGFEKVPPPVFQGFLRTLRSSL